VEQAWQIVNKSRGITRFHASHLNAYDHEFKGWTQQRSKRYVKALLKIATEQKRNLHATGSGLLAKDYQRIISNEGLKKFGPPYLVCFKSCISHIAQKMENEGLPDDWQFSVIFDRNEFEEEAERIFYAMKDDSRYKYRHRLGSCTRGSWQEFIPLQAADLIAYESYRYLHVGKQRARKALEKMFAKNGFSGYYWDADLLNSVKDELENMECGPNGFIPMFRTQSLESKER
jgi:hypothetical protein